MTMKSRVIRVLKERGYHCEEGAGVITASFDDPILGVSFPSYRMEITEQQIMVWPVDKDGRPNGGELVFASDDMFSYWLDI